MLRGLISVFSTIYLIKTKQNESKNCLILFLLITSKLNSEFTEQNKLL